MLAPEKHLCGYVPSRKGPVQDKQRVMAGKPGSRWACRVSLETKPAIRHLNGEMCLAGAVFGEKGWPSEGHRGVKREKPGSPANSCSHLSSAGLP